MTKISAKKLNQGNLKELKKIIENNLKVFLYCKENKCMKKHTPLLILGTPGIGKSDIIREVVEAEGFILKTYLLSQINYDDVQGLQYLEERDYRGEKTKITRYSLPSILNIKDYDPNKKYCIFFDELTNANNFVQGAAYQLFLDRVVGEYALYDNIFIIAGGNLADDAQIAGELMATIKTRFQQFEFLGATLKEFDEYMEATNFNKIIRAFINDNPQVLSKVSSKSDSDKQEYLSNNNTLTVNRTLTKLSDNLNILYGNIVDKYDALKEDSQRTDMISEISREVSSLVDAEDSTKIMAYIQDYLKLPSLMEILTNPEAVFDGRSGKDQSGSHSMFNYLFAMKFEDYFDIDRDNLDLRNIHALRNVPEGIKTFVGLMNFVNLFKNKNIRDVVTARMNKKLKTYIDTLRDDKSSLHTEDLLKKISLLDVINILKRNGMFEQYKTESLKALSDVAETCYYASKN